MPLKNRIKKEKNQLKGDQNHEKNNLSTYSFGNSKKSVNGPL